MVALIGGAMAKTASNSFAEVSGEGVESDGEVGFVIKNVAGDVVITISERDGWKSEKESPYTYTHKEGDTDNFYFAGREGEESVTVPISNIWECVHNTTNNCPHDVDPGFKVTTNEHAILMYAYPEKGCEIIPGADFEPVKGSHVLKVFEVPCPNPKCDFGKGDNPISEEIVEVEPSLKVETFVNDPDKKGIKVGDKTLYPHGTYTGGFTVTNDNKKCSDCCADASGKTKFDVCEARLSAAEYIGLDRTDAGYACEQFMTANVYLENAVGKPGFAWTTGANCMISGDSDKSDAKIAVKRKSETVPGGKGFEHSKSYRQEKLSCNASLSDGHGSTCEANLTLEGSYTVVKVDVQIEGTTELQEEERGAYTYYVPDGDSPLWQEEWTNSLKKVTITCEPSDGAMAAQTVDIKFTEHQLWVKAEDGTYEEAKNSYTVNELNKTTFYLHGHEKSEKYKGEKIVATHNNSGATDQAFYTVFGRPWLVPDYDRKDGIDPKDIATAKEGKKIFRFWINDDDDVQREGWYNFNPFDKGDIMDNGLHKSVKGGGNSRDGKVNGRCDLVDFTPLWICIDDVFPDETPPGLRKNADWLLESSCCQVVWTGLKRTEAAKFHTEEVKSCGEDLDAQSYSAAVEKLWKGGMAIPAKFLAAINRDSSYGVVMMEGCSEGKDLKIKVVSEGAEISCGAVSISVSGIEDMIRWINLRYQAYDAKPGKQGNYLLEPANRPDKECEEKDSRHFVFVHGYNINSDEAVGWSCECFKRMWQSGYNGKFTGVDWYGSQSQMYFPIPDKNISPKYWPNVVHAFMAARELRTCCDELSGDIVLMAHSLGNVLVSAAIADTEWTKYRKYLMLNAAVAQQAFCEDELYAEKMIDEDWIGVDKSCWSAHWYKSSAIADPRDFRKKLNWIGRFLNVPNKESFYSDEENVVSDEAWFPVWKLQETTKGLLLGSEAGWSVNGYYTTLLHTDRTDLLRAMETISEIEKVTNPLFEPFTTYRESMHSLKPYILAKEEEYAYRARCLAYSIPATSICVGGGEPDTRTGISGHRYEPYEGKEWPRDNKAWNHSDFICVGYYHLKKFFDELVKDK